MRLDKGAFEIYSHTLIIYTPLIDSIRPPPDAVFLYKNFLLYKKHSVRSALRRSGRCCLQQPAAGAGFRLRNSFFALWESLCKGNSF